MMPRSRLTARLALPFLGIVFLCCGSEQKEQPQAGPQGAPSLSQMKNMSYQGFDGIDGPIVLTRGIWQGEPSDSTGATRPRIVLAGDFRLEGDLDGDGKPEAAVLLEYTPGGMGQFTYLCVTGFEGSRPVNLATELVGDRVQIRDAKIIDNHIILDVVEAGPEDPACCPGQLATYGWTYSRDGSLKRSRLSTAPGRLDIALLTGTDWILRSWNPNESAPSSPLVLLEYAEGRFQGSGGCNRFFASVTEGTLPGEIVVGPVGSTQMACPDQDMKTEYRFLANLGTATKFGYYLGHLALTCGAGDSISVMLFDKR
jgi:hypothetical protein